MNTGNPQEGRNEGERLKQGALADLADCRKTIVTRAQRAVLRQLRDGYTCTADDVWNLVDVPTNADPRWIGSALQGLSRARLIVSVGRKRSTRPSRHAGWIDLWAMGDPDGVVAWLRAHSEAPAAGPSGQLWSGQFDFTNALHSGILLGEWIVCPLGKTRM